jgi:hypothetical protein
VQEQVHQQQQQQEQQQQQAHRRGRPPKQSGEYCQGYGGMLQSRQKKKAEVGSTRRLWFAVRGCSAGNDG